MKHQPWESLLKVPGPISCISHHGMSKAEEMYSDLVTTARLWSDMEHGEGGKTLDHLVGGSRRLSVPLINAHAPRPELPDWPSDDATVRAQGSVYERGVVLLNMMVTELVTETPVSLGSLGEQDHAADVFVEPMHHVEPLFTLLRDKPQQ